MDLSEMLAYRPDEDMTPAEAGRKALEILDERGWCKGMLLYSLADGAWPEGSHCVAGALNLARLGHWMWGPDFGREDVYRKLAKIIREQFPERLEAWRREWADGESVFTAGLVVHFNNHDDTTIDDIRLVLEKLAAG